jgi:hypothetical protein
VTDRTTTPETPATTAGALGADTHRPGEWPPTPCIDELLRQARHERARRVNALAAIREHLEEQPTAYTIRECKRRWCSDITQAAEDVITARQNTETSE